MNIFSILEPIRERFSSASAEELLAIEAAIGLALPEAYKDFLRLYGASTARDGDLMISTESGDELPFVFFDAKRVLDDIRTHDDFAPEAIVPFADDMFNNRFVFDCKDAWSVHFICWGRGVARAIRIAPTFNEFLGRLRLRPFDEA